MTLRKGKLFKGPDETGAALLAGIDLVADAVAATLGPCGRSVILQRSDATPLVTTGGLRIAEAVELVRDPFLNQGVQLLREVARENHARVGDGGTAAMLVSREIARESLRLVAAGASPVALRRGIQDAAHEAAGWLRAISRPLNGRDELVAIAASAARNRAWGELIADALTTVGAEGVVSVEDDRAYGVSLDFREGMSFGSGLLSPQMATDPIRRETVLDDPFVLVAGERITEISQLAPILQAVAAERRGLVLIADEISGDALTMLVLNVQKRRIPVIAVKSPMFGADREAALADIAILTGGEVFGPAVGRSVRGATLDGLGRADRVTATHAHTIIVGGAGSPAAIERRRRAIEQEIGYLETEYEREKRRIRRSRLGGSVAVIRVGRDTNTEQEETRNRLTAGVQAGRSALRGGVVVGGGAALARAQGAVAAGTGDEEAGRAIVRRALEAPLRQIAINAGIDPAAAVSATRTADAAVGMDVETGEVADLESRLIFDSTDVMCSVINVATSVGGTCLLAAGIVCDRPLPRMRRRSHGHHHGPDGGHFGGVAPHDHDHAADPDHTHADDMVLAEV